VKRGSTTLRKLDLSEEDTLDNEKAAEAAMYRAYRNQREVQLAYPNEGDKGGIGGLWRSVRKSVARLCNRLHF
jgi:hypothetical protein